MNKTILIIASFVFIALLLTGCAKTVKEIKNEKYVGEKVSVSGTVENTVKIGGLSGYTITDENKDSIAVKSDELPKEGSKMTISGILVKDTLFGYYIQVK